MYLDNTLYFTEDFACQNAGVLLFLFKKSVLKFWMKRRISQMTDDRKYIYVKGEKIYVSDEIYKAYKKQVNHEAYLNKSDKNIRFTGMRITRLI